MAYYHSQGTSGRLLRKFARIKELEEGIDRLVQEQRYCDDQRRGEINGELRLKRDSLKAIKSVVV